MDVILRIRRVFPAVVNARWEMRSQLVSRYLHVKRVLISNYCDTSTSPPFSHLTFLCPVSTSWNALFMTCTLSSSFYKHFPNMFGDLGKVLLHFGGCSSI